MTAPKATHENDVLMNASEEYLPNEAMLKDCIITNEEYEKLYAESIANPEEFWAGVAQESLHWFKKWDKTFVWDYPNYQWFAGGKLNITYNCLDRHVLAGNGGKTAYIYINENGEELKITYEDLLTRVCKFANGLKELGVKKGDRVTIYMPLSIEQIVAMLACVRIGAMHSVVYAGFSANALKIRIEDAQSKVIITGTYTQRRGKKIDLKSIVMQACEGVDFVEKVVVWEREASPESLTLNPSPKERDLHSDETLNKKSSDLGATVSPSPLERGSGGEVDYYTLFNRQNADCPAVEMDSEDPLFILYTSGTTGKPKGVLHTTAGYNLFTHYTTKLAFNLTPDDLFWCTADTGWITGHSYIVYGPLSNGISSLIYEGAPDYPDPGIFWSIIEKYGVTKFYTAPTAVRLFMKYGEEYPAKYNLSSLKIIGSVGEPINPEAWVWYYKNIGGSNAVVIDTWWQTETGGHMILSLPACLQKPGRAGRPFLGIEADVVTKTGESAPPNTVGLLVIKKPWPSALRTCWGDAERYNQYWTEMKGNYFAGDLATKDEDGFIMILGRADDVLNVSGHRIGTAEVESALVSSEFVAEAAVIGKPHDIKGQSIKGFVILRHGVTIDATLIDKIKAQVKIEIGSIGVPDEIEIVEKLPKTRSGKIMRRVLKAKELGTDLGDVSTLED